MFDKQYRFRGIHAVRVDALTSVFDEAVTAKLFERNVDVYTNAPLVGFLYNRRANVDDTKIQKQIRYIIKMSWEIELFIPKKSLCLISDLLCY